jgi:hypothetical protein
MGMSRAGSKAELADWILRLSEGGTAEELAERLRVSLVSTVD